MDETRDRGGAPSGTSPRRTGRPFDRSKDARILMTTLEALAEQDYDHITVEAIAAAAGTTKTTVYRRWPTKADLVRAAVVAVGGPPEADVLPDSGSLRADLIAVIDSPWLGGPQRRLAIFAGLASAARASSALGDVIRTQITEPYVRTYRSLLDRAAERGLLPPGARHRIPLVAEVVPALSDRRISGGRSTEREHFVAILDDVVLPALGLSGR